MASLSQTSKNDSGPFIAFNKADIEQSIPARFEQQVQRHSHRLAIRDQKQDFTYSELNGMANNLAWAILDLLGNEPEPIALLLDQSSSLVASILGILKAGKFYVPLDPQDPPARNARVQKEVQPRLIITTHPYQALAHQLAGVSQKVLSLETLELCPKVENPSSSPGPESLAYVYFTSGSTGRPKGVVDNHRNVLHNVMRYTNSLRINTEDSLSLIQGPAFSGIVSSLFGALLNGAVICPYNLRLEGTYNLAEWLNEAEITIYHSVPAIFRSFLRDGRQFPLIRLIRLEGDRASRTDVELYQQCFSSTCLLVNGLGTTETGLCRQYFINKKSSITDKILPVGYPVADMDIMLLDEAGLEVAKNQSGEIAVKSRYLSLGYWQQPELTQVSFFGDPEGGETRVYRTGDLGRLRPDGCLEYLGRKNFQLKVRGQRIAPVEVEQALLELVLISEAIVITLENSKGEAELVAYLVCVPGTEPSVADIRRQLQHRLPDAFIPARYVFLNNLPMTSDGKIDRRSLPEPEASQPVFAETYIAPKSGLEQTIAGIWSEVFALDRVGLYDDFLALGGDSIKAMQIISRLRRHLKTELTFITLFNNPRLIDLVNQIERKLRAS
jgi:amino acid adenylation domain-containing protein